MNTSSTRPARSAGRTIALVAGAIAGLLAVSWVGGIRTLER
jgi:hypothetical protein